MEMTEFEIVGISSHARGRIYGIRAGGKSVSLLFTFHALARSAQWGLSLRKVLQALLVPEEVLHGHRHRFIAHRRFGEHLVRAVYEYEGSMAIVVTVYYPSSNRYFQGGNRREDQIFS
jgi:hypothetical protein